MKLSQKKLTRCVQLDHATLDEAKAIAVALADKEFRALALTVGYLLPLPSTRARARVLSFVMDSLDEQHLAHPHAG